jgi:ABC-type glycerol-3-phosphate transport system substrate-binding protein
MEAAREYIASYNREPKNYEILYKARKYLSPWPRVPHLQQYKDVWSQQREAAFLGRSTPKEAMERAQRDLEYLIEKNQDGRF